MLTNKLSLIFLIIRECEIKNIHGFGVFVEVLPGYEGLVHISELETKRVCLMKSCFLFLLHKEFHPNDFFYCF